MNPVNPADQCCRQTIAKSLLGGQGSAIDAGMSPIAQHQVGLFIQEGLDQLGKAAGVVGEITIEEDDDLVSVGPEDRFHIIECCEAGGSVAPAFFPNDTGSPG